MEKNFLDSDLYSRRLEPIDSTRRFITEILPQQGWGKTDEEETVLDVGCGPGENTLKLVLPLFPHLKKIFAFDLLPNMIELAKKQNSHPKIEYHLVDILDWSSVEQFEKQITKSLSLFCFHWVKDQRKAFQNVFKLLKSGGEAAFIFVLQSPFYDAVSQMKHHSKWSFLLKDVDDYIPESHCKSHGAPHYKKMLEEIGFDVLHCKDEIKIDKYASYEEFANFFTSLCVLLPHIPDDHKDEFKNEFNKEHLNRCGRDSNGCPFHKGKIIEIIAKKN